MESMAAGAVMFPPIRVLSRPASKESGLFASAHRRATLRIVPLTNELAALRREPYYRAWGRPARSTDPHGERLVSRRLIRQRETIPLDAL